jgi:hypothetical protein
MKAELERLRKRDFYFERFDLMVKWLVADVGGGLGFGGGG